MGTITLLTGGSRSGKSTHALRLASGYKGRRAFVATAVAVDDEMAARIRAHVADRGPGYVTIEAPYDLAGAIGGLDSGFSVAVVDCLTVWLGNLFFKHDGDEKPVHAAIDDLCSAIRTRPLDLILVTN